MRILVKDERGAVAITIAIMSVVLIGMTAFAVDMGLAYANKRDLQKGADAGALAAASEIIQRTNPTETCAQIASRWDNNTDGFRDQVEAVADSFADSNRFIDSAPADMQVRCSSDAKRVEVYYANQGTTPGVFGGLFGLGDINTRREATADIFVRDEGTGLRPYFVCDSDLETKLRGSVGTGYVAVEYPSDTGDCDNYNGSWYTADCPNDGNNGTLDENTDLGCLASVGTVIDQSAGQLPITDSAVQAAIEDSCTDATSANPSLDPHSCLLSNPGNVASNVVVTAWDRLLRLRGIAVPIFDQEWNDFADAEVTKCTSGGNGGCFPVEAIAAVKVCAYKWSTNKFEKSTDTVACPGIATLAKPPGNDNFLWLRLTNVQFSGSSTPGGCPIGGNCDLGGRGTRLIL